MSMCQIQKATQLDLAIHTGNDNALPVAAHPPSTQYMQMLRLENPVGDSKIDRSL